MNKKWQKIIERFNKPDTALVVSAWPVTGKNAVNHGIAWYTEMTVAEMAKKQKKRFVILAEKNHENKPQLLVDGRILVLRIFDNRRKSLYPVILRYLKLFSEIEQVYVHSEFGVNGGILHFAMIVPFLTVIRAMGKKIYYYSHNVLSDVGMLSGHLNVNNFQSILLNIAIKIYYKLLEILCEKIVVLDPMLGDTLAKFVIEAKIVKLNMPVAKQKVMDKVRARKILGLSETKKIITYFGFVSWYKGADWLVESFNKLRNTNVILVVAGGPSYSLANKIHYKQYYDKILTIADTNPNVIVTGFVPEEMISVYMSAADLVVLPYRGFMGSSGSLSKALAYGKPFVVSNKMKEILHGRDNINEYTFGLNKAGMRKVIDTAHNSRKLAVMATFATGIAKEQKLDKLARKEFKCLYARTVRE